MLVYINDFKHFVLLLNIFLLLGIINEISVYNFSRKAGRQENSRKT